MRPYLIFIFILSLIILGSSCRKDLEYAPSAGNLEFSKDTVFLDTIFSNISSSTHTLKVYNTTRDDVEIPSIRLSQGESSSYRLNVDGDAGKAFTNITIRAQDSIFVFVETTFDASTTSQNEFLYTDAIQFDSGDFLQEVQLVSLVKDAVFLFPGRLADGSKETIQLGFDNSGNEIRAEGFELADGQLNFTNEKPYVIFGYAAVPEGKAVNIDAGARVHFHKDSGMIVKANASIQINGALSQDQEVLENEVIFSGDRLNSELSNVPGQWGTLWIASGSIGNSINHLTLKNATVGVFVEGDNLLESPTLTLTNTQIYNSASVNLWAKTAAINAENVVLGGSGNTSLYCNLGGKYEFAHCTIANYWSNGFRGGAALEIDNFTTSVSAELEKAAFFNCIIDGNNAIELVLRDNASNSFEYTFTNCLLKFRDTNGQFNTDPLYDFENIGLFKEILLNEDANFLNPNLNDFKIGTPSAVDGKANIGTALRVPLDLLGIDRTAAPAIGAYQVSQ